MTDKITKMQNILFLTLDLDSSRFEYAVPEMWFKGLSPMLACEAFYKATKLL